MRIFIQYKMVANKSILLICKLNSFGRFQDVSIYKTASLFYATL